MVYSDDQSYSNPYDLDEEYFKHQKKLKKRQAEFGLRADEYELGQQKSDLADMEAGRLPTAMNEDMLRQQAASRRERQMRLGGQRGTAVGTIANAMLTAGDERGEAVDAARMFENWRDQRRAMLAKQTAAYSMAGQSGGRSSGGGSGISDWERQVRRLGYAKARRLYGTSGANPPQYGGRQF